MNEFYFAAAYNECFANLLIVLTATSEPMIGEGRGWETLDHQTQWCSSSLLLLNFDIPFIVIVLTVLDAFGKPHSGILGHNPNWLGNYEECVTVDGYQHCVADLLLILSQGNDTQVFLL